MIVGVGFTFKSTVLVPVQPLASVTVTVYVNKPVVPGVTFVLANVGSVITAGPVQAKAELPVPDILISSIFQPPLLNAPAFPI